MNLIRLPAVLAKIGRTRSPFYLDIARGLFTRPVKTGARTVAWPVNECDQLAAARVAGFDEGEIRALVARLHAERKLSV